MVDPLLHSDMEYLEYKKSDCVIMRESCMEVGKEADQVEWGFWIKVWLENKKPLRIKTWSKPIST